MPPKVIPMLPCADIDEIAEFLTALGFTVTEEERCGIQGRPEVEEPQGGDPERQPPPEGNSGWVAPQGVDGHPRTPVS